MPWSNSRGTLFTELRAGAGANAIARSVVFPHLWECQHASGTERGRVPAEESGGVALRQWWPDDLHAPRLIGQPCEAAVPRS